MCLTGVDYFSTLGYQPSIAFVAAGYLSPFATLMLVAADAASARCPSTAGSPRSARTARAACRCSRSGCRAGAARRSCSCLLGFAATSFIITITLSAADAAAHIIENPFAPGWMHHPIGVTFVLVAGAGRGLPARLPRSDLAGGRAGRGVPRRQRRRHRLGARRSSADIPTALAAWKAQPVRAAEQPVR